MLKFVASDIGTYQSIMEDMADSEIGIDKYFSFVVMKSPFVKSHLPIQQIFSY